MSSTAPDPSQLQAEALDTEEVEARLAWLASAANEEEAHVIESALLTKSQEPEEELAP